MPKHRKDPEVTETISVEDANPSSQLVQAMRALKGIIVTTSIVSVYHVIYHNREMTRWTSFVTVRSADGFDNYEIYYDGSHSYFVSKPDRPNNENIRGIEIPKEER